MTHTCKVCGVTSDVAEFYNRVNTRCKECHKRKVREDRKNNAEYYKKYDANRYQNDPRVKERHKRYQKTSRGKASMQASRKKWLDNNKEKRAAHVILGNAVRDGRVLKKYECDHCGVSNVRIHGHHHDYAKPLDVIWLCSKCHRKEHE